MKLYGLHAHNNGGKTIKHSRVSITKLIPIVRILVSDGWVVSMFLEENRPPANFKPEEMR
jgi:hypothetical protein